MKHIYTLLIVSLLCTSAGAQIVFESNFENWTSENEPDGWFGTKSSLELDSVSQSADGPTQGSYLAELTNEENSHRRFTTTGISLEEGQLYEVEIWVKGTGELRTGLFDNDVEDGDNGYISYNSYEDVNSSDVYSFVQLITPDTTYEACELILSLRNGVVLVDRVELRVGAPLVPEAKTIYDIQFTMDPEGDSPETGTYVETSGIVTAVQEGGYFIQDGTGPWSGIRVLDYDNTVSLGDDITVIGFVEEYFDFTRINEVDMVTINGTGTLPAPEVVVTNDLNAEQYEGVLVRTVGTCEEELNEYNEWLINDGSGQIMVNDDIFMFTPALGTTYQVTGPLNYAFSAYKIEPRDADDVTIASGLVENPSFDFSIFPNPASDVVFVQHGESEAVLAQVYDIQGRVVMQELLINAMSSLDVQALNAGLYTLVLRTESSSAAARLEVK